MQKLSVIEYWVPKAHVSVVPNKGDKYRNAIVGTSSFLILCS